MAKEITDETLDKLGKNLDIIENGYRALLGKNAAAIEEITMLRKQHETAIAGILANRQALGNNQPKEQHELGSLFILYHENSIKDFTHLLTLLQ